MAIAISYLVTSEEHARSNLTLKRVNIALVAVAWLVMFLYLIVAPIYTPTLVLAASSITILFVIPIIVFQGRRAVLAKHVWSQLVLALITFSMILCLFEPAGTVISVDETFVAHETLSTVTGGGGIMIFLIVVLAIVLLVQSGVLMTLLLRSRDGQAEEGVAAAVEAVSKEAAAGGLDAMYVATGIQLALERSQVVEPRVTKSMKPLLTMARQDFIKRITVTSLDTGHFCLVASFVLLLSLTSFVSESWKVINTQTPIFDEFGVEYIRNQSLQLLRSDGSQQRLGYEPAARLHQTNKVFIILMDGLRLDYAREVAFWEQDSYKDACSAGSPSNCIRANDVALLPATNQLPSMSVPNWLTTLTGAPPELTGVLGNLQVPDTKYESIYSVAKDAGVMRMITGTPWFANIVAKQLPFLRGDGTISATYETDETTEATSRPADDERAKVAKTAIDTTDDPYELMLIHFSDTDSQGHCCGITPAYNEDATYVNAIHHTRDHVKMLLESLDANTVAFIVADHGHIDKGGHGGTSVKLRRIPIFVFKRGSNLSNITGAIDLPTIGESPALSDADTFDPARVTNLDLAPTVAALLGLTVPGQAMGRFMRPVLERLVPAASLHRHYQDNYAQKRTFIDTMARLMFAHEPDHPGMPGPNACEDVTGLSGQSAPHCEEVIDSLLAHYYNTLRPDMHHVTLNAVLGMLLALVLGGAALLVLELTTPLSPLSICFPRLSDSRVSAAAIKRHKMRAETRRSIRTSATGNDASGGGSRKEVDFQLGAGMVDEVVAEPSGDSDNDISHNALAQGAGTGSGRGAGAGAGSGSGAGAGFGVQVAARSFTDAGGGMDVMSASNDGVSDGEAAGAEAGAGQQPKLDTSAHNESAHSGNMIEEDDDNVETVLARAPTVWVLHSDSTVHGHASNAVAFNRSAFIWAVGCTIVYYCIALLVCNIVWLSQGYDRWDSTVIHEPKAAQLWLALVVTPTSITAFITSRVYHVFYHAKADPKERLDTWQRVARAMRNFFTDSHVKFDNSVHVYMIDRYIVLLSVFACLLVLVLACSFSFPFPGVLENRFVDSGRWAYRFRIITAMGFNCPLVLMSLWDLWSWSWDSVPIQNFERFVELQGLDVPEALFDHRALPTPSNLMHKAARKQSAGPPDDEESALPLSARQPSGALPGTVVKGNNEDVEAEEMLRMPVRRRRAGSEGNIHPLMLRMQSLDAPGKPC